MKDSRAIALPSLDQTGQFAKAVDTTGQFAQAVDTTGQFVKVTAGHVAQAVHGTTEEALVLTGAVAVSAAIAWASTLAVSRTVEWSCDLLSSAVGPVAAGNGALGAMLLWFFVLPFAFSVSFGVIKALYRGSAVWNFVPPLVLALGAYCDLMVDFSLIDIFEVSPWLAVGLVACFAGAMVGKRLAATAVCRKLQEIAGSKAMKLKWLH